MQYQIDHTDLSLVLALVRGRSLARAAELLQVDVSTVFRAVRRLEAALGVALFEKSRRGYEPSETARALAEQAERAEQALDAARVALELGKQVVSGTVRLTCTDAVLSSLLLPALARFMPNYPALALEVLVAPQADALELLRQFGAQQVQGYLVSQPLPLAELLSFMSAERQTAGLAH